MRHYLYILISIGLIACEKKELPIPRHETAKSLTTSVNMGNTYEWQLFYDLETNRIISQNKKTAWDLGFETSEGGFHVILNGSKSMFAYNTQTGDFSSINDTIGLGPRKSWDDPSGNLDLTAIGEWKMLHHVYVIDRGFSSTGTHLGFKKIKFLNVSSSTYTFEYGSLNDIDAQTMTITKNRNYNFTFFSFDDGNAVKYIEPPKEKWDLCFTQYTHVFYNPTQPYLVTGCLTNRYNTACAIDTSFSFEGIDYRHISNYFFSGETNVIGYNWKTYTGNAYTTSFKKNYVIKNRSGKYYKLHFIDFYNAQGEKGNPTWEYQEL